MPAKLYILFHLPQKKTIEETYEITPSPISVDTRLYELKILVLICCTVSSRPRQFQVDFVIGFDVI